MNEPDAVPAVKRQVLAATVLAVLGGMQFGLSVGFIPFYLTYQRLGTSCSAMKGEAACGSLSLAGCVWTVELGAQPVIATSTGLNATPTPAVANVTASCKFPDFGSVYCGQYASPEACSNSCVWDYGKNACGHTTGLSATERGIFTAGFFSGCVVGPIGVTLLLHRLWFRPVLALAIVMSFAALLFQHVGRASSTFAVLVIGRFFSGLGCSAMRYGASLFAFEAIKDNATAGYVTAALQPATSIGNLCAALFTYFALPSDRVDSLELETRIHAHFAMLHGLLVCTSIVTAFVIKEPRVPPSHPPAMFEGAAYSVVRNSTSADIDNSSTPQISSAAVSSTATEESTEDDRRTPAAGAMPLPADGFVRPLLAHCDKVAVGTIMCAVFLMTGLVTIQSYGPLYSEDAAGVEATLAPLLMQAFDTPVGLLSLVVRAFVSVPRPLMLLGALGKGLANILIACGVLPGIAATVANAHGLVIAGVGVFFFFLGMCGGST
jgi:hypothetical protein